MRRSFKAKVRSPIALGAVKRLLVATGARDTRIGADTLAPASSPETTGFAGLDLSAREVQVEADLAGDQAEHEHEKGLDLSGRIRKAIENDLLRVLCQPVVCLRTGSVLRWELLVRLVPADGWLLPPASFLAAAERFGLAERLDSWVISNAVDLLRRRGSAEPDLEVEVNVSAKSFTRAAFVEQVETEITSSGIPPESLVFGIPAVAAASETAAITEHGVRLANLGCRFALNNFGTGPTPFARLAKLPIDAVKIDGRLVRHLAADTGNKALIGGVAGLVDGMPTTVGPVKCVAMHVSNAATVAVLRECGVDYGQGSYLGRPLPLSELS